jgi:hypothetical protein
MDKFLEIKYLPLKAQNELKDFYEFLLQKYAQKLPSGKKKKVKTNNYILEIINNPAQVDAFKPFARDEIYER